MMSMIKSPSYLVACPPCWNVITPKALVLQPTSATPLVYALIICHVSRQAKQRVRTRPCRVVTIAYACRSNARSPRRRQRRPLTCIVVTTISTRDYGGLSSTSSPSSYRPYSSYKPSYYGSSRY